MIAGIDPGVSGAIAFFPMEPRLGQLSVCDLPLMQRNKTGNAQQLNGRELAAIIRSFQPSHVYLELVKGMPRLPGKPGKPPVSMGATSAFNFGETAGVIRGVLEALGIPYTLIPPEKWKRAAGLIGAKKDASRTAAIRLFPEASEQLKRKRDVGRAEALLIAHYGPKLA